MPREGHDVVLLQDSPIAGIFQSTCPARGTTEPLPVHGAVTLFQSTCPARGTTNKLNSIYGMTATFQSTCPARGTTHAGKRRVELVAISIHVPREGHDNIPSLKPKWSC